MSESLRICMVTTFYPPYHFGGDAVAVQRLARALSSRGHDVTVIHDVDAYRALGGSMPATTSEPADGVHVVALESRLSALSVLLTQQFGRPIMHGARLRQLLNGGRFDVVNFHNVSLIGGPGVLSAGGNATRIYTAHEHWLVCPTHVLWRHNRELCDARECLRCVLRHHRPPQLWRYSGLLDRQLRHIDAFIAMSEFSREKHREFGFPFDMQVLPAFLADDSNDAVPSAEPAPHARPYFLFVGRLERIKGLADLLRAFTSFDAADLLVVGDGVERRDLEEQAAGNPRVRFVGRLDAESINIYYRHARALVVPSVCYETFGVTLIEAFRQGTPVIARHLGPFPELVEASGGGITFSTDEQLVVALNQLASDDTLRSRLGSRARHAFAARWTDEVVLPKYLEIVRAAAHHRRSRATAISPAR